MIINKDENTVVAELSALYKSRGFRSYKLGCFEEYSLYRDNIDFLIAKNVITFSDLDGRLLAMRPDVTLSIIRHNDVEDGCIEKFYYNEKVYRQATGSKNYGEINQSGVEVIGEIDTASVAETTALACETLSKISSDYVLDLSHMGFIEGLLTEFGEEREVVSEYLKKKNYHDFIALAQKYGYTRQKIEAFKAAVSACGNIDETLKSVEKVCLNGAMGEAVDELKSLYAILVKFGYGDKISINFSSTVNADYYNGITFNGYVNGIPHNVLSGGRYDKLLKKMNKKGGAIGFALYLGEIERYFKKSENSVDILIIYDKKSQLQALEYAAKQIKEGKTVRISLNQSEGLSYGKIVNFVSGGASND